jgi:hypothetical protein
VPGRAWAAEGVPRLASQRAAAEVRGFGNASAAEAAEAAAAQHPASMRAQVPQRTHLIYIMISYVKMHDVCWRDTDCSCCLAVCLVCQAPLSAPAVRQMQPEQLHVVVAQQVAVGACPTLQNSMKWLRHQKPASELR